MNTDSGKENKNVFMEIVEGIKRALSSIATIRNNRKVEIDAGDFNTRLRELIDALYAFLAEKNRRYGNSALEPMKVFSQSDTTASIYVRLDDKLSRIANRPEGTEPRLNDVVDTIGYLFILLIAMNTKSEDVMKLLD